MIGLNPGTWPLLLTGGITLSTVSLYNSVHTRNEWKKITAILNEEFQSFWQEWYTNNTKLLGRDSSDDDNSIHNVDPVAGLTAMTREDWKTFSKADSFGDSFPDVVVRDTVNANATDNANNANANANANNDKDKDKNENDKNHESSEKQHHELKAVLSSGDIASAQTLITTKADDGNDNNNHDSDDFVLV
eukprot:CAMPEP_0202448334 /NCGR_PEP_ID=MMETSP1360-20130828/7156_1 /ASSEMBLY_ACC=CAM_ASM_000848 /TAXON_ID=515479 /ORGANISM="Licmophora paradoxa, Strain CCMP2313" /LENGTH=189 /DNA_ID=CAMNT_0049065855 /DNA_START=144 /DNA_END=713 /DNA_ORIENTATION=-